MNAKELEAVRKILEDADKWIDTPEGQAAMEEAERQRIRDRADCWKIRFTI